MANEHEELGAGVLALADLAQYQPGAVVSRTLVKKPKGTVTMFAFDAGEALKKSESAKKKAEA